MCEKCDDIHKKLISWLDESSEYIAGLILSKREDLEDLMKVPLKELCLMIHDFPKGSAQETIIKHRLANKDPFKSDLETIMQVLWDEEFSVEDYKAIGHNDGELTVIADMLRLLGDEKNAKKALSIVYSD